MAGVKGRSGGHNAKTIEQLKAEGTYDPTRHAGIENPEPPKGRPRPPCKLRKVARKEWRRMLDRLESSRTLSPVDDAALYQYCQLFEEAEAIAEQREGRTAMVEEMEKAMLELHGEARLEVINNITKLLLLDAKDQTQIRQYRMGLRAYLVEFGLTPASRGRVKQIGTKPLNENTPNPFASLRQKAQGLRVVK